MIDVVLYSRMDGFREVEVEGVEGDMNDGGITTFRLWCYWIGVWVLFVRELGIGQEDTVLESGVGVYFH